MPQPDGPLQPDPSAAARCRGRAQRQFRSSLGTFCMFMGRSLHQKWAFPRDAASGSFRRSSFVVMWCVHGVSSMSGARFDSLGDGLRLAYREDGSGDDMARCGFFWLGGFMSDMTAARRRALRAWLAIRAGRRCASTIRVMANRAANSPMARSRPGLTSPSTCSRNHTAGRRIVIGSSMGGWLALLLYRWLLTHDPARRAAHRRTCADRARRRHDGRPHVGQLRAVSPGGSGRKGRLAAALALWRSLSDHGCG